jgi:SAM-dependent methyltransferase
MSDSTGGPLGALVGPRGSATTWAREIVRGEVVDGAVGRALADRERSSADAVVLVLALHRCPDPTGLLAGVRHVLRPGGTLVVVTPSVARRTPTDLRWSGVLRPVRRGPWRHRSALDRAGWLLAAADFAVLTDERRTFALPLPDAGAARAAVDALPAAAVWPDLEPAPRTRLAEALAHRAGPGRHLPVPLRRLVARR